MYRAHGTASRLACAPANRIASKLIGRALRLSNGAASRLGAFRPTVHAGTSAPASALAPALAYQRPFFLTGVRLALSAGDTATPPGGGRWAEPGGGRGPGGVAAMAESDWDTVTVLRKKGPSAAQAKSKQVGAGSGGPGCAAGRAGVGQASAPNSAALTFPLSPGDLGGPAARRGRGDLQEVWVSRGIPVRCEAGARGGERGREAAPPGWAEEPRLGQGAVWMAPLELPPSSWWRPRAELSACLMRRSFRFYDLKT